MRYCLPMSNQGGAVARRAVGIIRVSQVAGREGESFASPSEQRERVVAACEREGLELVDVHEELDVSGGATLDGRTGLGPAVAAVEAGDAGVIVAAYFDRFFRNLRVQDEVVQRVESAGGQVLAVDVGAVSHASAGQWLSSTMLGAVSEYHRRSIKERSAEGQARAVARGVCPWPDVPRGYLKGADGVLVPDTETAPVIRRGFEIRASGGTIREVREHLAANGIVVSYSVTQRILRSPVYIGEIRFGALRNAEAHEPIVDRELWNAVQRVKVPRGRQPKSERLLARLGVLRCGGCDGRMGATMRGDGHGGHVAAYACPNRQPGDCSLRANIKAEYAEGVVMDAVREALADAKGRASAERGAREAVDRAERAQADLDSAIRAFASVADEPAAVERLAELRRIRDEAVAEAEQLGGRDATRVIDMAEAAEVATGAEWRELIRAVVAQAVVGAGTPGRQADRVAVELIGQ
jgi:DNA invertase Pin-like site-specific DNA recombinase